MESKFVEIPWPIGGLDDSRGLSRQKEFTTPSAQNVRPFDTLEERARGGQRPGLSKWRATQVSQSGHIQDLIHVASAAKAWDEDYCVIAGRDAGLRPYRFANVVASQGGRAGNAEYYLCSCWDFEGWCYIATTDGTDVFIYKDNPTFGAIQTTHASKVQWSATITGVTVTTGGSGLAGMVAPGNGVLYVWVEDVTAESNKSGLYRFSTPDGTAVTTNPWKSEDSSELLNPTTGIIEDGSSNRITRAKSMLIFSAGHLYMVGLDPTNNNPKLQIMDLDGNEVNSVDLQMLGSGYAGRCIDIGVDDDGSAYITTACVKTTAVASQTVKVDKLGTAKWYAYTFPTTLAPVVWLDATDPLTLEKNGSEVVTQWDDKSGNANHAIQEVAANRPTWTSGAINGGAAVRFDGTDDFMALTTNAIDRALASDLIGVNDWTIIAVVNVKAIDTSSATTNENDTIIRFGDDAGLTVYDSGSSVFRAQAYSRDASDLDTASGANSNISLNTAYILNATLDTTGTTLSIQVDDTTAETDTSAADLDDITGEAILGLSTNSVFTQFDLGELLIFGSDLSAANLALVQQYLKTKWGIDSPGPTTKGVRSMGYDPIGDEMITVGDDCFESGNNTANVAAATGAVSSNPAYGNNWGFIRAIRGGTDTGDSNSGYVLGESFASSNVKVVIEGSNKTYNTTETDQGRPLSVNYPYLTPAWGRHTTRRQISSIVVAAGDVKEMTGSAVTTVTGGLDPLTAGARQIFSAHNNGPNGPALFFADGKSTQYYDPSARTMTTWTASSGTLPVDSVGNRPSGIESWRGRTVLFAIKGDPTNWFMSKINDPFDFDYAAANCDDVAVSGNQAEVNKIPDIVNCVIPWSMDNCIFGGDHTIQMMSGDPAAGGRFDPIDTTIGMAFGRPWCLTSGVGQAQDIYFVSSRAAAYKMSSGNGIERISSPAIESRWRSINMAQHSVRLLYDHERQGVYFFFTPQDDPQTTATTNYYYDIRSQSWWADVFANKGHQPTTVHVFDGDDPSDRRLLLGCADGYVREIDYSAADDDGTAIDAFVFIPVLSPDHSGFSMDEISGTLDASSSNVTLSVHAGVNPETALANTQSAIEATMPAGTMTRIRREARGRAMYVKLRNATVAETFQMDDLGAHIAPLPGLDRVL